MATAKYLWELTKDEKHSLRRLIRAELKVDSEITSRGRSSSFSCNERKFTENSPSDNSRSHGFNRKPVSTPCLKKCVVFGAPLGELKEQHITEPFKATVPDILVKLCSYIRKHVDTQGLFRIAGSSTRCKTIMEELEQGKGLSSDLKPSDVADVLKTFLRQLPVALIPQTLHEPLRKCLPDKAQETIKKLCLLIPDDVQLSSLAYVLALLNHVSAASDKNRMTSSNLGRVFAPTLMCTKTHDTKGAKKKKLSGTALKKESDIIEANGRVLEMLINVGSSVAVVPQELLSRLFGDEERGRSTDRIKDKRRSPSLTRMLNGLWKKAVKKSPDRHDLIAITPPSLMTRKRRQEEESAGFSAKKKCTVLQCLPHAVSTPFRHLLLPDTPSLPAPNLSAVRATRFRSGRKFFQSTVERRKNRNVEPPKTPLPNLSHTILSPLPGEDVDATPSCNTTDASALECPSPFVANAILNLSNQETKDENNTAVPGDDSVLASCFSELSTGETPQQCDSSSAVVDAPVLASDLNPVEIPEVENNENGEGMNKDSGNRESESLVGQEILSSSILTVEQVYKSTLEQVQNLSANSARTDSVVRRLRRSFEATPAPKVIRSPSARRIGALRRRSRSFSNSPCTPQTSRSALRRGRPNTVRSGLPHPNESTFLKPSPVLFTPTSNSWVDATEYFTTSTKSQASVQTGRPSVLRLRQQNAGKVSDRIRIFDELSDTKPKPRRVMPALLLTPPTNVLKSCVSQTSNTQDLDSENMEPKLLKKCCAPPPRTPLSDSNGNSPKHVPCIRKPKATIRCTPKQGTPRRSPRLRLLTTPITYNEDY